MILIYKSIILVCVILLLWVLRNRLIIKALRYLKEVCRYSLLQRNL